MPSTMQKEREGKGRESEGRGSLVVLLLCGHYINTPERSVGWHRESLRRKLVGQQQRQTKTKDAGGNRSHNCCRCNVCWPGGRRGKGKEKESAIVCAFGGTATDVDDFSRDVIKRGKKSRSKYEQRGHGEHLKIKNDNEIDYE